jgi:uncharacterized protein YaiI (UPF0178 family)
MEKQVMMDSIDSNFDNVDDFIFDYDSDDNIIITKNNNTLIYNENNKLITKK